MIEYFGMKFLVCLFFFLLGVSIGKGFATEQFKKKINRLKRRKI